MFTQFALNEMTSRIGGRNRDKNVSYGDDNEAVIAAATSYIMRTERGQRRCLSKPEGQEDGLTGTAPIAHDGVPVSAHAEEGTTRPTGSADLPKLRKPGKAPPPDQEEPPAFKRTPASPLKPDGSDLGPPARKQSPTSLQSESCLRLPCEASVRALASGSRQGAGRLRSCRHS